MIAVLNTSDMSRSLSTLRTFKKFRSSSKFLHIRDDNYDSLSPEVKKRHLSIRYERTFSFSTKDLENGEKDNVMQNDDAAYKTPIMISRTCM